MDRESVHYASRGIYEVETQEENGKFNGFEFKFTPWTKGADRSGSITVENVISNNWATIAHNTSEGNTKDLILPREVSSLLFTTRCLIFHTLATVNADSSIHA